ncbi:MAG: hypothetical protein HZA93_06935 [Verrucomicrobia bacterium]|nr:hypothetical protein [Verrucomicrobiota bacterium]
MAAAADVTPRMLLLDGAVVGPDLVVVGERGTILRSGDQAQTWQAVASTTHATLTAVTFAPDARHGWAVGHDALILATADGGRTWAKSWQGESLADSLLDVLAIDERRVLAVGAYNLCLATDDGGKTWTRRKILDEDYHLNRLSRGPTDTFYLAGEHGTLLRSKDQGATWTRIATTYDGSFYGILPYARTLLLAHGLRGRAFRSTDDGETWKPIDVAVPVLLPTAVRLKSGTIILAGQSRALWISRDNGNTYTDWPVSLTTAIAELLELADGRILALGEAGVTILPKP